MVVLSSPFKAPEEGILLQCPSAKLLVNNNQEVGTGTLYITQSNVIWGGGEGVNGRPLPSLSILYPNICMHAIQRIPEPSLYLSVNYEIRIPDQMQPVSNDDDDDEDYEYDAENERYTDLKFILQNTDNLQEVYSAIRCCQAEHPDPADEVDEDDYLDGEASDEGDEEFEDAEESENASAERLRNLCLDNVNGGRFEDCEDADAVEE